MKRLLLVILILGLPSMMLLGFEKFLEHKSPEISDLPTAVRTIEVPAAPGAKFPYLDTSPEGEIYLTWLEPVADDAHALKVSRLLRNRWTQPVEVARGSKWFVNWADFPSLKAGGGGLLAAHWLRYRAEGKYDYDVRISLSRDSGQSWAEPLTPHRDGIAAEHGFVSMAPWRNGFSVFWLDGRYTVETPRRPMTLRHAFLSPSGELSDEVELDASVCDCCQTSAALTREGPIVAYRDRSAAEIRDIRVIRYREEGWSDPIQIAPDGWHIEGCPVNGPAIAASGNQVAVGWFTQSDDIPRVLLAFSEDAGRSFSEPVRVDSGDPYGRVDVLMDSDGGAWISWLESDEEAGVNLRLQKFNNQGPVADVITVGETSGARSSGFPRMTRYGQDLLIAWTNPGSPSQISSAWIR